MASLRHLLGFEIRQRRDAAGFSLADVAREIHCDPSYLAKIEHATRNAPEELIRKVDVLLGGGGALVRLHQAACDRTDSAAAEADVASFGLHVASSPDWVAAGAGEAPTWYAGDDDVVVPARDVDGQVIFVALSRRMFLQGLGGAAATAGLPPTPMVSAMPARRATVVADEADPLEHFRQVRRVLIDSDNVLGPQRVIPAVQEQISIMQQIRRSDRSADHRGLLELQTQFAEFAGWLWEDLGNHRSAQYWTDRALEWSHLAQRPQLSVYVLARKSQLAGDMGDGMEAVDVAEAALRIAAPRSRLAAVAATYGAHGYALLGDRDETKRAYDRAQDLLGAMDSDPDSTWGAWMDAAYLGVQRAWSLSVLGEHRAAADGFHAAIAALPAGYYRDKGVYLAREALAVAGGGEIEQAAQLGLQALSIGSATSSGRILTELSRLGDTLNTRGANASVNEFQDAMRHTVGRQA